MPARAITLTVAGVALLSIARARGQPLAIPRRHWRTIGVATFSYLFIGNIASTYSAILVPSGQAAVLGFTMPLWSALISWAVLGQRLTGRLLLAGALVLGDHQWFVPSWTSIAVFAWIALIPMSIGNVAWFAIVGLVPANVAGLSSITVPVVAMISGAIVHGEPLGALQWLAIACCVAALSLALIRPAARH